MFSITFTSHCVVRTPSARTAERWIWDLHPDLSPTHIKYRGTIVPRTDLLALAVEEQTREFSRSLTGLSTYPLGGV